jgi:hypothetical protein
MTIGRLRIVWIAMALAFVATPSLAQTTDTEARGQGIGLTADHKRTIYTEIGEGPARPIPPDSRVEIGARIPDSVMLNEMPISVKDRVGLLRDFKFAKLSDETIIIVDPARRRIVDIVTRRDGAQ